MSSMLRILLSQSVIGNQKETAIQFKNENVLEQVSTLLYRLLWKGKMQLLVSVFVNLKREEQKAMQKCNKEESSNNNSKEQLFICHSELLNCINLSNYIHYIWSKVLPNRKKHQDDTIIDYSLLQKIQKENLIRSITFWLDYVFMQRRITMEQIALLQSIMNSIKLSQAMVSKCQLLIKLAKENMKYVDKEQDMIQQSQKKKYKWIQQQLIVQGEINKCSKSNVMITNEQLSLSSSSTINTLLDLYKNYLSLMASPTTSHNHYIITSSLLLLTRQHSLSNVIQEQIDEFVKQISRQEYNLFTKLVNQNVQMISLKSILQATTNYWLSICFMEQLILFFMHNYKQQQPLLSTQSLLTDTQSSSTNTTTTTSNHFIQTILITLLQLYGQLLDKILHQVLQQGLQKNVKNNYYLSEKKLFLHISNLTAMTRYWLNCQNKGLSTLTKTKQCQQLLQLKSLYFNHLHHYYTQSVKLNNICKSINTKLYKIISFLSSQTGIHDRLLSLQEYSAKKLQKVVRIVYISKSNSSQQSSDDKVRKQVQLFLEWFVYDYEGKGQKELIGVNQTLKQQSLLVKDTYNKLISRIFQSTLQPQQLSQTQLHSIISSILNIPSLLNNSTYNNLQQTFQFKCPTFNNQYLTFNYIYGEMKDIYFYHNHHYSHVLLNIYCTALGRVLEQQRRTIQQSSHNATNRQFILTVFNKLRNFLGNYAKDHLLQANSKQFYQYLNMFKLCYITFTKQLLLIVPFEELILTFDLILNQIVMKENHPLIRQYIEIIMGRLYIVVKERAVVSSENHQQYMKQNVNTTNNKKSQAFYQCRNRMINMLDYDQQNIHNLNIGVPILMLLGYQLIDFIQNHTIQQLQKQPHQNTNQQHQVQDQFGSKQIKPFHQLDIHYILVKYISCHVAYMRTICQYYLSKFVKLMKHQNQDVLLTNLVNFWHSDKDSLKIMTNIALVIQGFKNQMTLFNSQSTIDNFYLCFEKVQEKPSIQTQYFLANDCIRVIGKLLESGKLHYSTKLLFVEKMLELKAQLEELKTKMIEFSNKNTNAKNQIKKVETTNKDKLKKVKPSKEDRRAQIRESKKQKLKQKLKSNHDNQEEAPQAAFNQQQIVNKLTQNLNKSYQTYQQINEPNVIIIATLLQKVHNFGYLVRTLTNHNAMLTVPGPQPFVHPECKQLLPNSEDIDVKVIEVKQKHLESFIKMYQQRGYPLIALEQCSKSITLEKTVFPQKYMLLLGNERIGAPASLLNMADILVQIPQIGKVRSLNVHVSMVICFWEYLKQKNQKKALQNK